MENSYYLLLLLVSLTWNHSMAQINSTDQAAFLALYNSLGGDNWTYRPPMPDPCNWYENGKLVSCDDNGKIYQIYLNSNGLVGTIPTEIGQLTELFDLGLYANDITGTLPTEIGNLINLAELYIYDTDIFGPIPTEIGFMTSFQYLYLDRNQLSGNLPTEIGNLIFLQELSMPQNEISGPIPTEIGMLKDLQLWYMEENQFEGNIPTEIGNLVSLRLVDLSDNALEGSIPTEIGMATKIRDMRIGGNFLSGPIPSEISQLDLQVLILSYNSLSSSIPSEISQLNKLHELNLEFNRLSGSVPSQLSSLPYLAVLALSFNKLSGEFHESFFNHSILRNLNLEDNSLSGTIPTFISSMKSLTILKLSDNQFRGTLPSEIWELSSLTELYVDKNQFTGGIPKPIVPFRTINLINLSQNQLSGAIPSEMANLENLEELYLSENDLSGSIPTEFGKLIYLEFLFLHTNRLSGAIPSEIGNLLNLVEMDLSRNSIQGDLPETIGNLQQLQDLILSYNFLTGTIIKSIHQMKSLQRIRLNSNNLYGSIPSELSGLNISEISLNDNLLTGTLPSELSQINSLFILRIGGTNNICPLTDYSSWSEIHDYNGTTCSLCKAFTCLNDGECFDLITNFHCECSIGFTGVNCEFPSDCPSNTYANKTLSCLPCPIGSTSPEKSSDLSHCTCEEAGFYPDLISQTCLECEINKYVDENNRCLPCPVTSTSPAKSIGIQSCTCPFGNFLNATLKSCEVPKCPFSNETDATWTETSAGTFSNGKCADGHVVYEGDKAKSYIPPSRQCLLASDGKSAQWDEVVVKCEESCNIRGCENGGKCVDSASGANCECEPSFLGRYCENSVNLVALIVTCSCLALLFVFSLSLYRFYRQSSNMAIVTVGLTIFDVITDVLFIINPIVASQPRVLYSFIFFFVFPIFLNVAVVVYLLAREVKQNEQTKKWFMDYYYIAAGCILMSSTNIEAFTIVRSKIFNLDMFDSHFSEKATLNFRACGLITNIIEDIPQLIIQIYVVANTGNFNTSIILSLISSIVGIAYGITRRLIVLLLIQMKKEEVTLEMKNSQQDNHSQHNFFIN